MEVHVPRGNVGKAPAIAVVEGGSNNLTTLKEAIKIMAESNDNNVVVIRSEGKEVGMVVFDETIFKEENKDMQEKMNDAYEELEKGADEDYAPIEPDKNKINKYDRFIQNKKNKQQFKSQKFNPKVASKFNGKNNMNLRRGGGR